jgi:hypothetical protein
MVEDGCKSEMRQLLFTNTPGTGHPLSRPVNSLRMGDLNVSELPCPAGAQFPRYGKRNDWFFRSPREYTIIVFEASFWDQLIKKPSFPVFLRHFYGHQIR